MKRARPFGLALQVHRKIWSVYLSATNGNREREAVKVIRKVGADRLLHVDVGWYSMPERAGCQEKDSLASRTSKAFPFTSRIFHESPSSLRESVAQLEKHPALLLPFSFIP
jgi:hypothetical protein